MLPDHALWLRDWTLGTPSLPGEHMNCRGCGVVLDPSEEQVNTAVDQILETSVKDAEKKGGVCPLCGHSKKVPYSHRKTVLFGLLLACLLVSVVVGIGVQRSRQTQREAVAGDAVARRGAKPMIPKDGGVTHRTNWLIHL
jgi:hypothetical protein